MAFHETSQPFNFRGSYWVAQVSIMLVHQITGHGLRRSIPRQGPRVYMSLCRSMQVKQALKPCQEQLDRIDPILMFCFLL
jgi:hypothetical protein